MATRYLSEVLKRVMVKNMEVRVLHYPQKYTIMKQLQISIPNFYGFYESLESFKDFIKEKYSSRSGFHSFYPNGCEVWMTEYLTDENIDNGIVEGYLEFLQDDDMDSLIYEVIDNSYELINY